MQRTWEVCWGLHQRKQEESEEKGNWQTEESQATRVKIGHHAEASRLTSAAPSLATIAATAAYTLACNPAATQSNVCLARPRTTQARAECFRGINRWPAVEHALLVANFAD